MLRKLFIIVVAVFLIIFGVNRVNQTKAVITSNYLVINGTEMQNLEELITAVGFYIPDLEMNIDYVSVNPYENDDGKIEAFIGDAFIDDGSGITEIIRDTYEGYKLREVEFNNNYLYNFLIRYENKNKKVFVESQIPLDGKLDVFAFKDSIDGVDKVFNLIRLK